MAVSASGVTVVRVVSNVISNFNVRIAIVGSDVVSTSGRAVDIASLSLRGTYAASGHVVYEPGLDQVKFVTTQFGGTTTFPFDREIFVPYDPLVLAATGTPFDAVRCGPGCVAIRYSEKIVRVYEDALFFDSFE